MKARAFLLSLLTWPYVVIVIWPIYVLVVVIYGIFRLRRIGFIKVKWPERIPHVKEPIILVCNHKGMLDIFLIPALLWRSCLWYLLWGRGPMFVADRKNFYDSWYFFFFRPFLIPVDRDSGSDKSLLRIKKALKQGRQIIYFYEGGRTKKGKRFLVSPKGKRIREPKEGIGVLVSKTGAYVQLFWTDGMNRAMPTDRKRMFNLRKLMRNMVLFRLSITVKVGKLMSFPPGMDKREITQMVTQAHLRLADE